MMEDYYDISYLIALMYYPNINDAIDEYSNERI